MEDGAIIHVDYDLFSGETGDLIETTRGISLRSMRCTKKAEPTPQWFVLSVMAI